MFCEGFHNPWIRDTGFGVRGLARKKKKKRLIQVTILTAVQSTGSSNTGIIYSRPLAYGVEYYCCTEYCCTVIYAATPSSV